MSDVLRQCQEFLSAIFEPDDIVEFRCLITGNPNILRKWASIEGFPKIVPWLHDCNETLSCYLGANPRKRVGGGKEEDVALARCVFADFDGGMSVEDAWSRVKAADLPMPTVTIASGGGVHCWWRLSEPMTDLAAWTHAMKAVIAAVGSDGAIHDPPRIMRLPGFVNHKYESKPLAELIDCDTERVYPLSAFAPRSNGVVTTPKPPAEPPKVIVVKEKSMSDLSRKFLEEGFLIGGGRRQTMFTVACDMAARGWSQGEAESLIMERMKATSLSGDELEDCPRQIGNAFKKSRTPIQGRADEAVPIADDEVDDDVDLTELFGGPVDRKAFGPEDPGPFPAHLLEVPGFVGEVMAYNLATAHRRQPVLALAGALCLQGVIAGRKVRDRSGTRTNIYAIGLAPTGMGKDHARRINKQILEKAGLAQLEGAESVASHAAIETAVADSPAILFQFDEFGRFLKTLGDSQRSPHLFGIVDVLMKLFTSSGGTYRCKGYASKENNREPIHQPCAVLYGTTVEDSFLRSLTHENISDGLLGRVLIFEGERHPPLEYDAADQPAPPSIVRTATYWRDLKSESNLPGFDADPMLVETVDEADLVFRALVSLADREYGKGDAGCELWTRALEKARKLALVYACSANHEQPIIDGPAALWAVEVVQYMTRRMIFLADRWIADGRFDALQKEVVRKVEKRGGRVTASEMARVVLRRVNSRERDEVLKSMIETGQLRRLESKSKTKTAVAYEVA
jgi:hypothetical protein